MCPCGTFPLPLRGAAALSSTTLFQEEVLLSALDAHTRAVCRVEGGDLSSEAIRGEIGAINRLLDAAVDCGMDVDEPDLVGWSAICATRFLTNGDRA